MATRLPDLTGQKVGEYEIIKPIGVGGMGAVYEGVQKVIGKRVAVKVLLPQLSSEPELVERFLSEARAVNAVRHRGIVDIFSFGQLPDGANYFVMEYLDGKALDGVIKERSPMEVGQALSWMDEVLEALDAAHHAGVIHRDIKPSNLFLVDSGRGRQYIKLLDFGIAKLSQNLKGDATPQTRASMVIGTPDYMSPEQARGKAISPQTDIYALGCVLFELLTRRRPFEGENPMQTMFMHVEEPPPAPSVFNPNVPREVDELILWMLQKDPAARPGSADECRLHVHALASQLAGAETGPLQRLSGSRTPSPRTPLPTGRSPKGSITNAQSPRSRAGSLTSEEEQQFGSDKTAMRMTPAPGQNSLAPLSPPSIRTRQQPPPELDDTIKPNQTREQLLGTATGAGAAQPRSPTSVPVREPAEDLEPVVAPKRSPLPFVVGGALVVGLGIGAFVMFRSSESGNDKPMVVEMPVQTKPVETRPAEVVKVEETKPSETKPVEVAKVEETRPSETKPSETKPVEVAKPLKTKPAETKPVVVAKAETKPAETKPVVVKADAGLTARLEKLRAKLKEKEALDGRPDKLMRSALDEAAMQIKTATTDKQRKDAKETLDAIQDQITVR